MRIPVALAGALFALTAAASITPASAATLAPHGSHYVVGDLTQVHWNGGRWHSHRWGGGWGYCRAWRHECAERWGWGTWRFRRCLRIHGC